MQHHSTGPNLGQLTVTPLSPPTLYPALADLPVILSIPHSGRDYPDWLVALSRNGRKSLECLEDPLVDELACRALGRGIGAVVAQAPRAAIDCNRAEDEVDPTAIRLATRTRPSPRARAGLGIVPSRTAAHGHLWRQPIGREQFEDRLQQAYRPYHRAIEERLAASVERFGCALLLDCHSMPSSKGSAEIVLGDRFGRSAAPWLMSRALSIASEAGFRSAANDPFAGGHIVDRHGSPQIGVHAIQLEIERRCYLTESARPGGRFDDIAKLIDSLVTGLGTELLHRRLAQAAE